MSEVREKKDRDIERVRNGVIICHLNYTAINHIREERERASDTMALLLKQCNNQPLQREGECVRGKAGEDKVR